MDEAENLLAPWIGEGSRRDGERLDVPVSPGDLQAAVAALLAGAWGYLAAITGLDLGSGAGELEVLYHFAKGPSITTLRVRLPRETPVVGTICGIIPSASFFERELMEMLGVTVAGTPDPSRLFLPDEWPQGVYPLRKDFNIESLPPADGRTEPRPRDPAGDG